MKKKSVGIIGAGIGGLTIATLLSKRGYKVTIFEKEPIIGGRALSFKGEDITIEKYKKYLKNFSMQLPFSEPDINTIFKQEMLKGYTLDLGYHAIGGGVLSNVNGVLKEFDEHVDFLESYVGYIDKNGWRFPFLSKKDKIKILPKILRMLLASEKTLQKLDSISMSETISKYGKGNMKLILEVFSRSITTLNNLDEISTGETFRAQRNLYKGSKPVGYPVGSLKNITDKFEQLIKENKGEIHLKSTVEKIIIEKNKAIGLQVNGKKYDFDIIISNILVQNLFEIADEKHFKKEYIKYIKSLNGTASLCAYYALDKINPVLIGKTFHFIERNLGVEGEDAVGMIDLMPADPDSKLSPKNKHLIQSYIICTPKEAKDKTTLKKLKDSLDRNLKQIIPDYKDHLIWAIYPSIWHLDGVAKTIKKDKPDIETPIKNLYLVGDCVKAPGIGFNCALNSARILNDKI